MPMNPEEKILAATLFKLKLKYGTKPIDEEINGILKFYANTNMNWLERKIFEKHYESFIGFAYTELLRRYPPIDTKLTIPETMAYLQKDDKNVDNSARNKRKNC